LPVAVNCWVVPNGIELLAGATVIETSTAGVIVRLVVPLTLPTDASMIVEPVATLWASPLASTIAMLVALEVQVAAFVRSFVVESV
jgi:hypothetical protein